MNTSETLFPPTIIDWNKLYKNIRNSESVSVLKSKSLNLSDQALIVRLMDIILIELDCLQDYGLG